MHVLIELRVTEEPAHACMNSWFAMSMYGQDAGDKVRPGRLGRDKHRVAVEIRYAIPRNRTPRRVPCTCTPTVVGLGAVSVNIQYEGLVGWARVRR